MKILHAAVSINPSIGVVNQMQYERRAAKSLSLDWTVKLATAAPSSSEIALTFTTSRSRLLSYLQLRMQFYKWLEHRAEQFDAILLRHSVHDIFESRSLSRLKNVWLVHHTLELPELRGIGGAKGKMLALGEKHLGNRSLRRAKGIVCVTEEIANAQLARLCSASLQIPSLIYPNGILCDGSPANDRRSDAVKVLFVASSLPSWHGLDLLVTDILTRNTQIQIHFVGFMSPKSIGVNKTDGRFVFHGFQDYEGIRRVAAGCDISLSCLALYRKSMHEACPLKTRESLALGLPVYGGYTDSGLPTDFRFYRRGSATAEQIHLFAIETKQYSREHVLNASREWIDKRILLARLHESLAGLVK